jgi:hypothetical protein
VRCVSCGEVHWNLGFSSRRDSAQECRLCGGELRAQPGSAARRFERLLPEARDVKLPRDPAGFGPSATS